MLKPMENLSRNQRRETPVAFALYLLAGVRRMYLTRRVAVLFTARRSNYVKLYPWVEMYGVSRDAHSYRGPWPVICHPPCGPWGVYKAVAKESKEHGIWAMECVHRWGGCVEQPRGSSLFREHGRGGVIESLNQCDYGFRSLKPTLIYWYNAHG